MPVYDYKCKEHGVFNELATMEESQQPKPCPSCGQMCARVIVLPPEVLAMSPTAKKAAETNERASNEPVYSTKDRREFDDEHARGCGCQGGKKSKLMYTAQGDKMFPSMRPWMISH